MLFLPYNRDLKEFSRLLRNNSTLSEILLWNQLKAEKMMGYQFNRQKPLDNYIVDFYAKRLNLVIEIDGISHQFPEVIVNDEKRQKILEQMGLNFLRFTEIEVRKDMNGVLKVIKDYIIDFEFKNPEVKPNRNIL
jgi:very-short-patch-repair endonuclease